MGDITSKSQLKRLIAMERPEVIWDYIASLEAQLKEAREVIEFYADPDGPGEDSNFCVVDTGKKDLEGEDLFQIHEIGDDGITKIAGEKARAFLAKFPEGG